MNYLLAFFAWAAFSAIAGLAAGITTALLPTF
jgi:hypothetical protein